MIILGIETSCDETAAAVVKNGTKILSNIVASSQKTHAKTGGIIPEVAARAQINFIIPVIKKALSNAKIKHQNIDAIAVTNGPGLIGSLLVGVETAKTLSQIWNKPIIPINHLKAHIYANWLEQNHPPKFPAIILIVSGGHSDIVLMKSHKNISWLGGTRDDAAGEAFDKTARLLGLGYPGGPAISIAAKKNKKPLQHLFPRPMLKEKNLDFSFSGLKTAVLNHVNKYPNHNTNYLAAEIEQAIVDTLVTKTISAIKEHKPKSLLLAGGVAANSALRDEFKRVIDSYNARLPHAVPSRSFQRRREAESEVERGLGVGLHVHQPALSTDNAVMIASCAYFNYHPVSNNKVLANPNLSITS